MSYRITNRSAFVGHILRSLQMPKELEFWNLDEVLENFDSFLTPETSSLLLCISALEDAEMILMEGPINETWWACLNPTQQSEIIYAYENFDPENSRFEPDP